ncbi:hypothetical protein ACFS4T_00035 [Pseudomonas lini]
MTYDPLGRRIEKNRARHQRLSAR